MSSSFPLADDLEIWVYDLFDERTMLITDATDVRVEDQLQGVEELSFRLNRDDPRSDYIIADALVEYSGRFYRVRDYEDEHPQFRTVICDGRWIELTWRTKTSTYSLLGKTPAQGVDLILSGSGWTQVDPPANATLYTAEDVDPTLLSMLRRWASLTGYEIEFDTAAKTVKFIAEVGEDQGVGFRYGHNLRTFKRKYRPPQATRLYPYGANNLTITNANPTGQLYIEDYSWYIDQGMTLAEARAAYRKDFVWVDDTYLEEIALYDAAVLYLAALAQPSIEYSGTVLNLARLTESDVDDFHIGDYVRVEDEVLGVSVTTRVVRLVRYPRNPKADEIELEFLNQGLVEAQVSGTREIDYGQIFMLVDSNTDILTINATEKNFAEMTLTSTGEVTFLVGGHFLGTASGSGTVQFTFVVDGVVIGGSKQIAFTDGQQVEHSWPSYAAGVTEGAHDVHWRAQIISGAGTITLPAEFGRAWLITRGAIGIGTANNPNAFISEELLDVTVTIEDTEYVVTMYTAIGPHDASGIEETLADTTVTLTERVILPFQVGDPTFGQLDGPGALQPPD